VAKNSKTTNLIKNSQKLPKKEGVFFKSKLTVTIIKHWSIWVCRCEMECRECL